LAPGALRQQDPLAYLERIRLAMKAGNTGWSNRWRADAADYQTSPRRYRAG
jgi:hypothetical protein